MCILDFYYGVGYKNIDKYKCKWYCLLSSNKNVNQTNTSHLILKIIQNEQLYSDTGLWGFFDRLIYKLSLFKVEDIK